MGKSDWCIKVLQSVRDFVLFDNIGGISTVTIKAEWLLKELSDGTYWKKVMKCCKYLNDRINNVQQMNKIDELYVHHFITF